MRISPQAVSYTGLVLAAFSLSLGRPALLSIGTILIVLGAVWQAVQARQWPPLRSQPWVALMMLPFVFSVIWGLITEDIARYPADLQLKLPFLLIPPAMLMLKPLTNQQWVALCLAFAAPAVAVAWVSVADYAFHFEAYQHLIVTNSSLPIYTKVSHIYFGVILAAAVLLCLDLVLRNGLPRQWRVVFAVIGLLGFVGMHVLTSRTGQLAMYIGLLAYGVLVVWQRRSLLLSLALVSGAVATPVAAYYLLPSFQSRIDATFWDLKEYLSADSKVPVSDLSVGARFVLIRASWEVFAAHPLVGTGIADIEIETNRYTAAHVHLPEGKRMPENPHNQYLEYMAGFGLPGMILALLLVGYPFSVRQLRQSRIFSALMALLAATMLTESILERQIGIMVFLLLTLLARHFVVNSVENLT